MVVKFRDDVDLEQIWKKVFRAWSEGDVLATVGTGSLTPFEEREFGLVGDHNYSIFGILSHSPPPCMAVLM
jgi:calpain-7